MIFNLTKTTHQNALTEKQERIVTLSQMIGIINNLVAVHGTQQTDEATFVRVTGEGKGRLTETFEFKHAGTKWISVEDHLPDDSECVLTYREGGDLFVDHIESYRNMQPCWFGDFISTEEFHIDGRVLYWQPISDDPLEAE